MVRIVPLDPEQVTGDLRTVLGGKAAGLLLLLEAGARVPPGFVLLDAQPGQPAEEVLTAFRNLGGPVAVRSSAMAEDGAEASYAGQFETVLNVASERELVAAIDACLASAAGERAAAYQSAQGQRTSPMAVIVQRMVDAAQAGVIFTADPVSHRRDVCVVDAVNGLGETLVSGTAQPDHFEVAETGIEVEQRATAPTPLQTDEILALARQARVLAVQLGQPLDLEWAFDQSGTLYWLQARPITTLAADPCALDVPAAADHVLTRCNISEVMPGAVTPLTQSVTGRGIDWGMQAMMVWAGAAKQIAPNLVTINSYFGHLFLNMSAIARISGAVAGSTVDQIGVSVCGRAVPELHPTAVQSKLKRAWNGFTYARYLLGAGRRLKQFQKQAVRFLIPAHSDAPLQYHVIKTCLPMLMEAYDVHMRVSAGPGAATGALHEVLAREGVPENEIGATVARLFSGLGGVEGTDLIGEITALAQQIGTHKDAEAAWATDAGTLAWLQAHPEEHETYDSFLARHGHRAVRELELAQPGWRDDPVPLLAAVRAQLGIAPPKTSLPADTAQPSSRIVRLIVGWARKSVQRREASKSLLVQVTDQFKLAYRRLGEGLALAERLKEPDDIFFLTHNEIGQLIDGAPLTGLASQRKAIHGIQSQFQFPDVFVGRPTPLRPQTTSDSNILAGLAVSRGVVEGAARVALSPAEAADLQPGEILIAPITDIGWSPYFALIAGLATDIGSSVSHGAVVAREYGIPAVVNTFHGTRRIKTGDRVRLDGDRGTVEILS